MGGSPWRGEVQPVSGPLVPYFGVRSAIFRIGPVIDIRGSSGASDDCSSHGCGAAPFFGALPMLVLSGGFGI